VTTLDEREWIDQNAIASRALTPLGRRRFTLATKMLLQLRFVEPQSSVSPSLGPQAKKPRYREALLVLVGPGGLSSIAIVSGD